MNMRDQHTWTVGGNGWFRCGCGDSKWFPSWGEAHEYAHNHVCPVYDTVAPTGFELGGERDGE
jgi:hypothetical protein